MCTFGSTFNHAIQFPSIQNHKIYISQPHMSPSCLFLGVKKKKATWILQVPNLFVDYSYDDADKNSSMHNDIAMCNWKLKQAVVKYKFGFSRMKPIKFIENDGKYRKSSFSWIFLSFLFLFSVKVSPKHFAEFLPRFTTEKEASKNGFLNSRKKKAKFAWIILIQ